MLFARKRNGNGAVVAIVAVCLLAFGTIVQAAPIDGLIGYWTFDEGSGTIASDTSGAGPRNGTLNPNDPALPPIANWTPDGKFGGAVAVDGSKGTGPAALPSVTAVSMANMLSAAQPRTISAWIKPTSALPLVDHPINGNIGDWHLFGSTGRSWFNQRPGEWFGFSYTNQFDGALVVSVDGGLTQQDQSRKLYVGPWSDFLDDWHMLTVSHPGGTGTTKAYVDGVLVASMDQTLANPNSFGVSVYHSGMSFLLDDLQVYNRVLSDEEVYQLWIPEPSSLVLLMLGVLSLLSWPRRRQRRTGP